MTDVSCSQAGCLIGVSGRCLEGFEPTATCPYQVNPDKAQEEVASYNAQDFVDLPSGDALTERQATEVTRDGTTNVVIIAGPYGSGKTTILTSLFEAFQEAPFGNYLFRGSRTLVGFERRCHLGREESGFDAPDTAHTSLREGVVFLHLDLGSKEDGELQHAHLLLSDISGEMFKRLRDSSEAVKTVLALRRANHLCLVLDGEKIVNPELRQVARNDSRSIFRSIVESNMLTADCIVDVAFTKWDIVVEALNAGNADETRIFIESTKSSLQIVAQKFTVRFHEVAARPPKDAKVPFAHGLPTLLRSWMGQGQSLRRHQSLHLSDNSPREMGRYTDAAILRNRLEDAYDIHRP